MRRILLHHVEEGPKGQQVDWLAQPPRPPIFHHFFPMHNKNTTASLFAARLMYANYLCVLMEAEAEAAAAAAVGLDLRGCIASGWHYEEVTFAAPSEPLEGRRHMERRE